jgi:hypothetical protein
LKGELEKKSSLQVFVLLSFKIFFKGHCQINRSFSGNEVGYHPPGIKGFDEITGGQEGPPDRRAGLGKSTAAVKFFLPFTK